MMKAIFDGLKMSVLVVLFFLIVQCIVFLTNPIKVDVIGLFEHKTYVIPMDNYNNDNNEYEPPAPDRKEHHI